jgi:cell wall assembly regulator SMI1
MKKAYYILTIIISAMAIILFGFITMLSSDEALLLMTSAILMGMAIGCFILSVYGLKKDCYIPGIILQKAGVLIAGFGAIVVLISLFSENDVFRGVIFGIAGIGAGLMLFGVGGVLVKDKKDAQKSVNGWNVYKEALLAKMPFLSKTLRAGVKVDAIKSAETEMGIVFPEALKKLYLTNDGDDGKALCGMICGFHFLSLEALRSEWRSLKTIADNPELNNRGQFSSDPVGCVRKCYADAKWIPIFTDGSGNFIGIDLDPDMNGTAGQVINFGRDEYNKTVLAGDLNAFFERITRFVNSNDFYIDEYDGEQVIMFRKSSGEECAHLTDYLKSVSSVQ